MDNTLSLTSEAYEELKAKIIAVGYGNSRIKMEGDREYLDLDSIGLIRGDDKDLKCYLVYKGGIVKTGRTD